MSIDPIFGDVSRYVSLARWWVEPHTTRRPTTGTAERDVPRGVCGNAGYPVGTCTTNARMKWFMDMVDREDAASKTRGSGDMDVSQSQSSDVYRQQRSIPPSPAMPTKARMRYDNQEFQTTWGLGESSSILPLPLETEINARPSQTFPGLETVDEAERSLRNSQTSTLQPEEPRVLRFDEDQRLVRYVYCPCLTELVAQCRISPPVNRSFLHGALL